jgi:hypothetical protein
LGTFAETKVPRQPDEIRHSTFRRRRYILKKRFLDIARNDKKHWIPASAGMADYKEQAENSRKRTFSYEEIKKVSIADLFNFQPSNSSHYCSNPQTSLSKIPRPAYSWFFAGIRRLFFLLKRSKNLSR